MDLATMKNKLADLMNKVQALTASEDPDAVQELANVLDEAEKLKANIETKERAEKLVALAAQPAPRNVPVSAPKTVQKIDQGTRLDNFISALPHGGKKLQNALTGDGFEEGVSANGGYILPVDKKELIKLIAPVDMVHSMCDTIFTQSNAVTVPTDADTPWASDLAAGVVSEGADMTADESAFGTMTLTLTKNGVLTRVTAEMLEDNTGIGAWVTNKLGDKLSWALHAKAIAAFNASGGKKTITSDRGTNAAPDLADIQAMWAGMLAQHRTQAVWLINPALETALQNLVIGTVPVYLPPTGIEGQPYGRLFGRPAMMVEGMAAQGAEGDIMLVAPQTFYAVYKQAGPRIEASAHAEFKADVVQYRAYVRSIFASKFAAVITRPDSTTAGNVVTLEIGA